MYVATFQSDIAMLYMIQTKSDFKMEVDGAELHRVLIKMKFLIFFLNCNSKINIVTRVIVPMFTKKLCSNTTR